MSVSDDAGRTSRINHGRENGTLHVDPALLTIILTTSPVPSIPSTELVKGVLDSLPAELDLVPLIISFDGFTISQNDQRLNGRLKKGQIPQALADLYPAYIAEVKALFHADVSPETEDSFMYTYRSTTRDLTGRRPVTFLRQRYRQGFGYSIKAALPHCTTPHVLILQHDWVFATAGIPWHTLLRSLQEEREVRYITFIARQSRRYALSRGSSCARFKAVFDAAQALRRGRPLADELVACLHFFDRPHLCSVALYRQIFDLGRLRRGDFVEDTVGTWYGACIANAPTDAEAIEAWRTLGAWIHQPGIGDEVAIRHTSGRTVLAKTLQEERIREYVRTNRSMKQDTSSLE